jgi:hypothetical protein
MEVAKHSRIWVDVCNITAPTVIVPMTHGVGVCIATVSPSQVFISGHSVQ